MSGTKYHYKKLLNFPRFHSVAAISIRMEEEGYSYNEKEAFDGDLTISDCNRSVTLDLSYSTNIEKANALRKIDTIIQGLTETKEWIEDK